MSQAGLIDIEASNPQIPTQFDTDSGNAVPIANVLELLGGEGIETSASGNTITISIDESSVGQTITGDTGGALNPTAGNWNILGLVSVKSSGSGSTLSLRSDILTYTAPIVFPYTILSTDDFISVTTASENTVNLPNAPQLGKRYTIKDRTGMGAANPINITTVGGIVTIDGSTSYNMNSNYGSIDVVFNGTSYEVF